MVPPETETEPLMASWGRSTTLLVRTPYLAVHVKQEGWPRLSLGL